MKAKLSKLFYIKEPSAGFTLIELLAAMALVSIVISLTGFGVVALTEKNKKERDATERRVELNRAQDFISDEVRTAIKVDASGLVPEWAKDNDKTDETDKPKDWINKLGGGSPSAKLFLQIRLKNVQSMTASDELIRVPKHGFFNGNAVMFTGAGTLPGELAKNTVYYVKEATDDTFKVSSTVDGSAINLTTDSSGSLTPNRLLIYYIRSSTSAWLGPKTINRSAGPCSDDDTVEDSNCPVLVDSIATNGFTATAIGSQKANLELIGALSDSSLKVSNNAFARLFERLGGGNKTADAADKAAADKAAADKAAAEAQAAAEKAAAEKAAAEKAAAEAQAAADKAAAEAQAAAERAVADQRFTTSNGTATFIQNSVVDIQVLGGDITCGAGGVVVPTTTTAIITNGGKRIGTTLSSNTRRWDVPKDSTLTLTGDALSGNCSGFGGTSYNSVTHDKKQVLALRNGDAPPLFNPFGNQPRIDTYLTKYLNPATGRITISANQVIYLFELGAVYDAKKQSEAYDMQDLVVLATVGPTTNTVPVAPAITATAGTNVKLSWGAVTHADAYGLYRSVVAKTASCTSTTFTFVSKVNSGVTQKVSDITSNNNNKICFAVNSFAVDSLGTSSLSNIVSFDRQGKTQTP